MTRYVLATLALIVGVSISSACERCTTFSWNTKKAELTPAAKDDAKKDTKKVEKTAKQKKLFGGD